MYFVLHYAVWCCRCGKAFQWMTTVYDIGLMPLRVHDCCKWQRLWIRPD